MAIPAARPPAIASGAAAPPSIVAPPDFAAVYDEHFTFVWRSALRLGTPRTYIDDVVQETFVVVHRRLASFEGRSSMKTWLFGILVNVLRKHRRAVGPGRWRTQAQADHAQVDVESVADPAGDPHDSAARAEAVRLVDRLLDGLDEDKRTVFVLAELEQMSAPDIARALEIPLNTVYSRLRLARQDFASAAARHRARDEWRMR